MARLRVAVTIDAQPAQVWADLQAVETHVEWMEEAVAIRFIGSQRRGVGTTYECDTAVGPFRLTDVMEITEWEPGRSMGVRHVGLVTGTGVFTLRRKRRNRTRFTWTEQLVFPWWLGGPITALGAKPVLTRIWRRNLRSLAARFG
jgi:hypothetical protein